LPRGRRTPIFNGVFLYNDRENKTNSAKAVIKDIQPYLPREK
jgi:hypothetical protein